MSGSTTADAEDLVAEVREDLEALVAISSPSGDAEGAGAALAYCAQRLPTGSTLERVPCSSPDHAPDLIAHITGTGTGRILLLGHVDTVVANANHLPLRVEGDIWRGSGSVDMKGGVALSLGLARRLAERPERFAELALLLVVDEEWRVQPFAHGERFTGFDACLCFEAGERTSTGAEGVVVQRKAAGTLRVTGHGRAAHAGSNPDAGANALLALAHAATVAGALHAPRGPEQLSVVPSRIRSGDAINVVPADGELTIDVRARDHASFQAVLDAISALPTDAALEARMMRIWPGMDTRAATSAVLGAASSRLGRPIVGVTRGGASDASHLARAIPVTIDGLGPRGGHAHSPQEFVDGRSLAERSEVATAVAEAILGS